MPKPSAVPSSSVKGGARVKVLLSVVAIVAAVAGAAFAATRLLGGDSGDLAMRAKPVTDEPEESWTFRPDDASEAHPLYYDKTSRYLVSWRNEDGETSVAELGDDGEPEWTIALDDYTYALTVVGDVVLTGYEEGPGITGVDRETGDELWSRDENYVSAVRDGIVILQDEDSDEVVAMDITSGEELWSANADSVTTYGDAVYTLDGSSIEKRDFSDGDVSWSYESDFRGGEDNYVSMAANESGLIASDDYEYAMVSSKGDELESDSLDYEYDGTGVATKSLFYRVSDPDEEYEESTVTFYGADGNSVGSLVRDSDTGFYGYPITIDGVGYFYDNNEGELYNEKVDVVNSVDGELHPVEGGFYAMDDSGSGDATLSYRKVDTSSALWEKTVDSGVSIRPVSGGILAFIEDKVTLLR